MKYFQVYQKKNGWFRMTTLKKIESYEKVRSKHVNTTPNIPLFADF